MTTLRVLTGEHAGASLPWTQETLSVGPDEALDVYIGDWSLQPIELRRDEQGRHLARWIASPQAMEVPGQVRDGEFFTCVLQAWLPLRFGSVILCIGPSDEPWPDDAQLLQRCFAPVVVAPAPTPPVPSAHPVRPRRAALAMAVSAAALLLLSTSVSRTPAASSAEDAEDASRVSKPAALAGAASKQASRAGPDQRQLVLEALGVAAQSVSLDVADRRILVRGFVTSRAALDDLNRRLDLLATDVELVRRVVAVPQVIDHLKEALPGADVRVIHSGQGRFEVSATADDTGRRAAALDHVIADLSEFGLRFTVNLQPRQNGMPAMRGMLIESRGTSFVRTRDGTKHLLAVDAAQAEATTLRAPPVGTQVER